MSRPPAQHGTQSGYARHIREHDQPCIPCKTAHAQALAAWRRQRRQLARRRRAA